MSESRGMEAGKRKTAASDDVVSGRQKKARENDAVGDGKITDATEEEVEEFFAILRRIHVAIGHFKKGGDGRKLTEEGSRLRTMLEGEIVSCEEAKGVKDGEEAKREEGMEENLGLDLNAEPGPDCDPV